MFSSGNNNNNNNRNLKRSLSKSTSISSLKSILSKSFGSSNNLAGTHNGTYNGISNNKSTKKPTLNKSQSPSRIPGANKSYGTINSNKSGNSTSPFKKIRLFKLFQSSSNNSNSNFDPAFNLSNASTSFVVPSVVPTTAVATKNATGDISFLSSSSEIPIPFKVPISNKNLPSNENDLNASTQYHGDSYHNGSDNDIDISMEIDYEDDMNNNYNQENNQLYTPSPTKPGQHSLQDNMNIQNLSKLEKVPMATSTNIHFGNHQTNIPKGSMLIPPSRSTFSFDANSLSKKTLTNNISTNNRLSNSKAYYNLSQLAGDTKYIKEPNEETHVSNRKTRDGYLASSSPSSKMNSSSYLDYFHDNIEQFSSIKIHKLTTKLSKTTLNESENVFHLPGSNISGSVYNKPQNSLFHELINDDGILKNIFLSLLNFENQRILLNAKKLINKERLNFWKKKVESFKFLDNTTKLNEYIFKDFLQYDDTKYSPVSNNTNYSTILNNLKSFKNCLLVNRRFYEIGKELINYKLLFQNDTQFINFIKKEQVTATNDDDKYSKFHKLKAINCLILYKLNNIQQDQINYLSNMIIKNNGILNLKHLEFYIISNQAYPPMLLFTDNNLSKNGCHNLESLILAGCNSKKINNFFLKIVSINCPKLKKLDLRSCEHFTDNGLIEIGNNCLNLENVNVGRFNNKDKITDSSINLLIKNLKNLNQLGCAGCNVTESILYQLLKYQNSNLKKLSLNYCENLRRFGTIFQKFIIGNKINSNNDSFRLLFPNLHILEIRKLLDISDDISQLIRFKKLKLSNNRQFLLDIGDSQKLKDFMLQKEFETSVSENVSLFKSLTEFCNNIDDPNDDDVDAKKYYIERSTLLKRSSNDSFHNGMVGMQID